MIRSRSQWTTLFLVPTLTLTVACGSADETDPTDDGTEGVDEVATNEDGIPYCPEDPSLQTGEPCVDPFGAVLCKADTGFPGDELRVCPPEADQGMLLHHGPWDYDDPDVIDMFLLEAGGEDEFCTFANTPNQETAYVGNYRGRMRPGSHHLIVTTLSEPVEPTDIPGTCSTADTVGARWLVGSQDPIIDVTVGGGSFGDEEPVAGDPDFGLAQVIDANTSTRLDLHYTNPTTETILKEAWVYFDYRSEDEVVNLVDMITFFQGEINVPPQQQVATAKARCEAPTDRYVGLLTSHFHETGIRSTVWHERADGTEQVVYETFDWAEPGNLYYRDGVDIEPANEAMGTFGGDHEGYLHMKAGEALVFDCEFRNFKEETVTLGNTAGDEMCNIFGMYYPTDGNVWDCACLGESCFVDLPEGSASGLL